MATLTSTQLVNASSQPLIRTSGSLVKHTSLFYDTRVGVSGSADATLFSVSYTKEYSYTNLIVRAQIWGHGPSAGVCGTYIAVAGTRNYDYSYHYDTGGQTVDIHGISLWTGISAGSVTITAGWATNDGQGGNQPFNILNQNQGDGDSRYWKHGSTITVWEITA
jgi:hypothetical protein